MKSWKMEDTFKGLLSKKQGSEVAICLWCNAEFFYIKGKTHLTAHARTYVHVKNTVTPKDVTPAISVYMVRDDFPSVLETEAKITSFLVSNNLPFSLSDQLIPLLKAMPPKSVLDKVRLKKQKAVKAVRQGLGPYYKQKVVEEMKEGERGLFLWSSTKRRLWEPLNSSLYVFPFVTTKWKRTSISMILWGAQTDQQFPFSPNWRKFWSF